MRKKIIFILVGHGSRNSETIKEFNTFQKKVLEKIPNLNWGFGFLEYSEPSIEKIISKMVAQNPEKIVLVPLFLFSSKHVKKDLPKVLQNFEYTKFVLLDSFKINYSLINLLTQRIKESSGSKKKMRALVVVGRGAKDENSNEQFQKIVRIVEKKLDFDYIFPTFIGITKPKLEDSLKNLAKTGYEEIVVVPYLLFTGFLINKIKTTLGIFSKENPSIEIIYTPHLGVHPLLIQAVEEKIKNYRLP